MRVPKDDCEERLMNRRRRLPEGLAAVLVVAIVGSPIAMPASGAVTQPFCLPSMTIQSRSSGRFVSAELGYAGSNYAMLRARATAVGPWEEFQLCQVPRVGANQPVSYALRSLANGRWVVDHRSYPGSRAGELTATASSLTAASPASASREQIWLQTTTASAFRVQGPGSDLLSQTAQRWVSAELADSGGYYGMLRARATVKGPWEIFIVRFGE